MSNAISEVMSVFGRAVEIASPCDRAAFLDEACAGRAAVRAEVEELLNAHGSAGSFMGCPAAPAPETASFDTPIAEGVGSSIGPYRLMEQVGEGGMGLVFVAEQHQPVRRKVALKVIKPGMDTRQVVARFEAERQALALMDHPNIAKVLDAGTTAGGLPYFVMELVRGVPITEYCDAISLPPQPRLEVFLQVCKAVLHAHQKGVIHRDLKPSNILVAPHDGAPVVKVIDFGVAKALGQQLTEKTIYTSLAQMIGTPLYMSPEQAEINQLDVDTRSDVYSLGVLLYELFTGTTPLDRQRLKTAAHDEIRRIIREDDPPRPSTRLTTLGEGLRQVSAQRGLDPARLSRFVRGELDWIVMRCLEKDRTRRYETVAGLAKDLTRFLADEPVEARPASVWYRARKAYRRNRAALIVAAGFALSLVVGLGLVTWKWQDERIARADADAARRDAEDRAREVLDGAEKMNAANAAIDLAGQHAMLLQWAEAEAAHNRAIELRPDHFQVWLSRGELYAQMGLWDRAFADYVQSFSHHPPDTVRSWYKYALLHVLLGDESGYRRVCRQMVERFGGSDDVFTRSHLVRACALIPNADPGDDWLAQSSGQRQQSGFWAAFYSQGLDHFRAGRDTEAIGDLRESLTKTNVEARAMNFPVLAVALHRSGDIEAARRELGVASGVYDRSLQAAVNSKDQFVPWGQWHDWAEFLVHYRTACRLIEHASPAENPRQRILREQALDALRLK